MDFCRAARQQYYSMSSLANGKERKDIQVIRAQVLFLVRANKTLPAAEVVYIMNKKNEYW